MGLSKKLELVCGANCCIVMQKKELSFSCDGTVLTSFRICVAYQGKMVPFTLRTHHMSTLTYCIVRSQ